MLSQNKPRRNAFTFSMSAVGGYICIPPVAADRLNKPAEQQQAAPEAKCEQKARRPLWRRRRSAT